MLCKILKLILKGYVLINRWSLKHPSGYSFTFMHLAFSIALTIYALYVIQITYSFSTFLHAMHIHKMTGDRSHADRQSTLYACSRLQTLCVSDMGDGGVQMTASLLTEPFHISTFT